MWKLDLALPHVNDGDFLTVSFCGCLGQLLIGMDRANAGGSVSDVMPLPQNSCPSAFADQP